jgi:hypothetical protein
VEGRIQRSTDLFALDPLPTLLLLPCIYRTLILDLPARFLDEARECKPVVVLVLLEVGEGEEEKGVEVRSGSCESRMDL